MTAKLGKYHAAFLDRIGSLYFTKENYDDFYYGKGSTYPDVNGSIGILFEQASSRGHSQQTANGILDFSFTIRNQFITTLSTLEGAKNLRKEFLDWQREFYKSAMTEAAASPIKAYVFGDEKDEAKTAIFVNMLLRHQIEIFKLKNDLKAGGHQFENSSSYLIPSSQPQWRLIKAIFEKNLDFKDSLFYDITSWTMPLAFGLPYAELGQSEYNSSFNGERIKEEIISKGSISGGHSDYGYLLDWTDFYAPAALYELQKSGITVKVATNAFEMTEGNEKRKYGYGTLFIPVNMQTLSSAQIESVIKKLADKYPVHFHAVKTGNVSSGSDLGSNRFQVLTKPSVAMLVGTGVNALDAGEVWHLFDQRMNIPLTHLEIPVFNRIDLSAYNTLIMVSGSYGDLNKEKLKTWVQNGGNLICLEDAVTWAAQNGISTTAFKKIKSSIDSTKMYSYVDRVQQEGAQQMNGVIFRAEADLSHPLAYGYTEPYLSVFKSNKVFMERSKNPYANPFYYRNNPLQSGWLSKENKDASKNASAVTVQTIGSGRVISMDNNPNFRAFWLGGMKLMMNAVFFGRIIDAASARTE